MTESNKSFITIVAMVLLGAFFATTATVPDVWKNLGIDATSSNSPSTPSGNNRVQSQY
jgi:hypothetical protein